MDRIAVSLSHAEGLRAPRTLTSAVLERLRADILSTRLGQHRDDEAEHRAIVEAVTRRDAVAAISQHFVTTMRFVELAAHRLPEVPAPN
jgi:hypothetical protein